MAAEVRAQPDQRSQHRQRVLKGASILTGVQNSEIKCAIRNMNKAGADLEVDIDARVPQTASASNSPAPPSPSPLGITAKRAHL